MSNTDLKTDLTSVKFWIPQYKTLDHWRGIAVLWVMIFHGFGTAYDKSLHPLAELINSVIVASYLFYRLVEKPLNDWRHRQKKSVNRRYENSVNS